MTDTERTSSFSQDEKNQQHARAWAVRMYGEDNADQFVKYLCGRSIDEQIRVFNLGYPCVQSDFEAWAPEVIDKPFFQSAQRKLWISQLDTIVRIEGNEATMAGEDMIDIPFEALPALIAALRRLTE